MSSTQLPLRQSIRALMSSSRAYWIVNLANFGDGIAYFGILTFLTLYLGSDQGVGVLGLSDHAAHLTVSLYTGLVTLFMLNGGRLSDGMGVRQAITWSLVVCTLGRALLAGAPSLGLDQFGTQMVAWVALAIMAYGTGVLQPALFAGVKEYTDERTSSVGWSLLYAIMNVGIVVAELASPMLRTGAWFSPLNFLGLPKIGFHGLNMGIQGIFWVITALSALLVLANLFFFTPGVEERERTTGPTPVQTARMKPFFAWLAASVMLGVGMGALIHDTEIHPGLWSRLLPVVVGCLLLGLAFYLRSLDKRFAFFIFILVPVRTLFAHQWLTMPGYVFRCFEDTVSDRFEWLNIINPLLVAIATPLIAAVTLRVKVVDIMIVGTAISAFCTFLLVLPPDVHLLVAYFFLFSIGEAIWAARFFEYVASLSKPGETGAYMGVANLPWFLAKLVTGMVSGDLLARYVPKEGRVNPSTLWLIYGLIAIISPLGMLAARNWILSAESRSPAADRGNSDPHDS